MRNQQYDNNRTGALWPARERRSEKSPHFTGHFELDGVKYDVAMWEDPEATGRKPLFKFRVTPQSERPPRENRGQYGQDRGRPDSRRQSPSRPPQDDFVDSEVPW